MTLKSVLVNYANEKERAICEAIDLSREYNLGCISSNSLQYFAQEDVLNEICFRKWLKSLEGRWGFPEKLYNSSEEFFLYFQQEVPWKEVLKNKKFSECFYKKLLDLGLSKYVVYYSELSISFLEENLEKLDCFIVSERQKLTEEFMDKFEKKLDWSKLVIFQNFSYEFAKKHRNRINRFNLQINDKLDKKIKCKIQEMLFNGL